MNSCLMAIALLGQKFHMADSSEIKLYLLILLLLLRTRFIPRSCCGSRQFRPAALGHYLNDQPMAFCQIVLKHELIKKIKDKWSAPDPKLDPIPIPVDDPIPNVWIPFSYPEHPFHCQIHRDAFPYSILPGNLGIDHRAIIDLRWFTRKEYAIRITWPFPTATLICMVCHKSLSTIRSAKRMKLRFYGPWRTWRVQEKPLAHFLPPELNRKFSPGQLATFSGNLSNGGGRKSRGLRLRPIFQSMGFLIIFISVETVSSLHPPHVTQR